MVIGLIFGISGCNYNKEGSATQSVSENQIEDKVGTNGDLISINSSNVSMAGYDVSTRIMTVKFLSGGIYEYYEVPLRLWEEFLAAQPHPWSSVGYHQLVGEHYKYRRIG